MILYLLRHSDAEFVFGGVDQDRSLTDNGYKRASLMGEHFKKEGIQPDLVLSSPAQRAQETLEAIIDIYPLEADVIYDNDLYLAYSHELRIITRQYDGINSLMIVGHNNGLSEFASQLTDQNIYLDTCDMAVVDTETKSLLDTVKV